MFLFFNTVLIDKKFDENIVISEYIEKELASNLINRISEFNKNKTTS